MRWPLLVVLLRGIATRFRSAFADRCISWIKEEENDAFRYCGYDSNGAYVCYGLQ